MRISGRFLRPACSITLAALLGFAAGCASAPGPRGAAPENAPPAHVSRRSPLPWGAQGRPDSNHAESAQSVLLRAGAELRWSVESATARSSRWMSGRAVVGPDGTIELGPYGTVQVAGLTVRQARIAVTNHLSTYLANPEVGLAPEGDPY
jgi:protein involved in polysaccharide export with SLBB domain